QRDDEPAATAADAGPVGEPLLARAARHHDVPTRQDRRRERAVERVRVGERRRAGVELPFLFAVLAVQSVDETAEIGEVDRVGRDQGRTHDAAGRGNVAILRGADELATLWV